MSILTTILTYDWSRDGSRERPQQMPGSPLPSRCSSKLKLIIGEQKTNGKQSSMKGLMYYIISITCNPNLYLERQLSLGQDPTPRTPVSGPASLNASPYVSPYGSPCSSPRIKRKPLKVRRR